MSSNPSRAALLVRALRAGVEHDRQALTDIYTDDVKTWTPALSTGSVIGGGGADAVAGGTRRVAS